MPQGTIRDYDLRNHNGVLLLDDRTEVYFDRASTSGSEATRGVAGGAAVVATASRPGVESPPPNPTRPGRDAQ